jgi:hypothetical protein
LDKPTSLTWELEALIFSSDIQSSQVEYPGKISPLLSAAPVNLLMAHQSNKRR